MRFFVYAALVLGLIVFIFKFVKNFFEDKAISVLIKPAEDGDITAQATLGDIYRKRKKWGLAFKWYQMAADSGFSLARYNLALLYHSRFGISAEMSFKESSYQALKWILLAASPDIPYIETTIKQIETGMRPEDIEKAWQETKSIRAAELKRLGH